MRKRIFFGGIAGLILLGLVAAGSFSYGVSIGEQRPQTIEVKGVTGLQGENSDVDFGTFWQAWKFLDDISLKGASTTVQDRMYGAISGLVGSLDDPYSVFFTPEQGRKFEQDIQGSFSGIGAEIGIRNKQLMVISPIKDSPAIRAGLKAGDAILKVDNLATDGISIDEAIVHIRGPEGTTVKLLIGREGWDAPKEIPIVRAPITAPTLDWKLVDGKILHIQLYAFNSLAEQKFAEAVFDGFRQGAQGIVLDLRNNPGGYLGTAVSLAGWFMPRGTLVVSERDRNGTREELYASGNGSLREVPVAVLVNGASASASEILAGAIRSARNAKLIGEKTFGKGTVQDLVDLRDGSRIKLTIANWVLPDGTILEGSGISPDIEVKIPDDYEPKPDTIDPQLAKALEVVKGEMAKKGAVSVTFQ